MSGRLGLLLLFGVPLGLMFGAWLIYTLDIAPQTTHNRGQLIRPPVALGAAALPAPAADARQWSLLLPASGCDDDCDRRLQITRQVHIALGREAWRFRRLHWDASGEPIPGARRRRLDERHPGMLIDAGDIAALNRHLRAAGGEGWADKIYLVDPDGFLMMRYEPQAAGEDILEDLRFLLKTSRRLGE